MTISLRQYGSVTIVSVQGKITGDGSALKAVRGALESGTRSILVDMAGITMIDSTGIGELTSARTAVAERGGDLKLLIPPAVASAPGIGLLPSGFAVFRDEKDALASFSVAR